MRPNTLLCVSLIVTVSSLAACARSSGTDSTPMGQASTTTQKPTKQKSTVDSRKNEGAAASQKATWAADQSNQAFFTIGSKPEQDGNYRLYAFSHYNLVAVSFELGDVSQCIYGKAKTVRAISGRTEDNKLAYYSESLVDPKTTSQVSLRLSFDGRSATCYEYAIKEKDGQFEVSFKTAQTYAINMAVGGYGTTQGQVQQGGSLASQIAGSIDATFGKAYPLCLTGAAQACSNDQAASRTLHHCNTNEVVAMVPGNPLNAVPMWAGSGPHATILQGAYGGSCLDIGYSTTDGFYYFVTAILR